ncbi:MAG: M48 family metallopeptidase [Candidatus Blackburnbacteria bacterium]|nr:M48 family metallopeptidase [Candidatus Blackburnbacteria bacterium]
MRNITNVYEAVGQNKLKSVLVMLFFIAFVTGIVWIFAQFLGFGPWVVGFALVISGLMSLGSYWWSDKIVLSLSGARPAQKKKDFRFYTVGENLSMAAGIPMPRLYVIDSPAPNAFATGRDPNHAAVAATSGLLEKLDRTELEGVIAHELSHIRNYDTRLMAIVAILAGMIIMVTDIGFRMSMFGGRDNDRDNRANALFFAIAIVLAILAPIIAQLIQFAISRRREFLADASAVYLTRFPDGLARALAKIAEDRTPAKFASNATAHLFIENPFKADVESKSKSKSNWLVNLFSTHPPVEERIKALQAMA